MTRRDYLALGDWNAECSMCGRKFKASELSKHWEGMYRCRDCYEERHPQDFVRGITEAITPPWVQKPPDTYIYFCTAAGTSAMPGASIPGCMLPSKAFVSFPT